ncbi:hypothetical protein Patl1_14594 [Pistacia atlantica]|uniref:Uncharacterized protein n=1 Tax=Pistacia atlantica TaxID=434234 RepID=A0ACC1ASZ9_9ROSI|nr:hypothetical protein Patl1_14594 [Pistacia atlantica]
MEIHEKESTIIRPAAETPTHRLWLSNLDMFVTQGLVPTVHFYSFSPDFSELCSKLKQALSKVLVAFYPVAGRFATDENGGLRSIVMQREFCSLRLKQVVFLMILETSPQASIFLNLFQKWILPWIFFLIL